MCGDLLIVAVVNVFASGDADNVVVVVVIAVIVGDVDVAELVATTVGCD